MQNQINNQIQQQKDKIIRWNYQFPVDKWFRDKYNIAIWSEEHLTMNQIDITNQWLEEQIYHELEVRITEDIESEKSVEEGQIVRSNIDEDKLFDEMKY